MTEMPRLPYLDVVFLSPTWEIITSGHWSKILLSTTSQNWWNVDQVAHKLRNLWPIMCTWEYFSAWNGRPWPGRSQNWMLMYFIINLSGSQQFSGSSIQNQVELSEWATGRFMHWYLFCLVVHFANNSKGIQEIPLFWLMYNHRETRLL